MAAVERGEPNPIHFTTPCGKTCRAWLGHDFTLGIPNFERSLKTNKNRPPRIGDDRHWRVHVKELLDQEEKRRKGRTSPRPWRPTASALNRPIIVVGRDDPIRDMDDALGAKKGFKIRLCVEAEKELQILGCGWRIVTVELDGPKVRLHHNGNTATMKRPAFKALIAANRLLRRKRPVLRLVVSNPPPVLINSEAA